MRTTSLPATASAKLLNSPALVEPLMKRSSFSRHQNTTYSSQCQLNNFSTSVHSSDTLRAVTTTATCSCSLIAAWTCSQELTLGMHEAMFSVFHSSQRVL